MINESLERIANQISQHTERVILEQLNELLKRGLLVLERGPMQLSMSKDPVTYEDRLQISQTVKLKLKDQEYIEALEKRVEQLQQLTAQPVLKRS